MRGKRRTRRRYTTKRHRNKRRRGTTRRNKRKRRTKRRVKQGGAQNVGVPEQAASVKVFQKIVREKLDEIENYIKENRRCLGLVKEPSFTESAATISLRQQPSRGFEISRFVPDGSEQTRSKRKRGTSRPSSSSSRSSSSSTRPPSSSISLRSASSPPSTQPYEGRRKKRGKKGDTSGTMDEG